MPKKSHFDVYLEYLQRSILAWEALRLNPEYRKDWEDNKKLLASPKAATPNSPAMCWLKKIARSKWGIPELLDPYTSQEFQDTSFLHCRKHCIKTSTDNPWNFSLTCTSTDKKKKEPCFHAYLTAHLRNPFLSHWNHAWVFPDNPFVAITPASAALGDYLKKETASGHIVLWIRPEGVRERVQHDVFRHIASAKAKLANPPRKAKPIVKFKHWKGFLLLSIPLGAPDNLMRNQVKMILAAQVPYWNQRQIANTWGALKVYEARNYKGESLPSQARRRYGNEQVKVKDAHGNVYSRLKSFLIRKLHRQYAFSKQIIKTPKFVPPAYNPCINWQDLSPKTPPQI